MIHFTRCHVNDKLLFGRFKFEAGSLRLLSFSIDDADGNDNATN